MAPERRGDNPGQERRPSDGGSRQGIAPVGTRLFTEEELAQLRALPPVSRDELDAISRESPEESTEAADRIIMRALDDATPLRPRKSRGFSRNNLLENRP